MPAGNDQARPKKRPSGTQKNCPSHRISLHLLSVLEVILHKLEINLPLDRGSLCCSFTFSPTGNGNQTQYLPLYAGTCATELYTPAHTMQFKPAVNSHLPTLSFLSAKITVIFLF